MYTGAVLFSSSSSYFNGYTLTDINNLCSNRLTYHILRLQVGLPIIQVQKMHICILTLTIIVTCVKQISIQIFYK